MRGSDPGRLPDGITMDNWQTAPYLHWSFQHMAELLPTAVIPRGDGPAAPLPVAPLSAAHVAVGGVMVREVDAGHHWHPHWPWRGQRTVAQVMAETETDGWMVLHRGTVVAEEYLGGMEPSSRHLLMSVSKTLVGSVAGALLARGVVDLEAPLTAYVPALAASGYAGATIRHLLDMRSGIAFNEDYLDPDAEVRLIEQASGWTAYRRPDVPDTMCDFLLTLKAKGPHGGPFEYRSCETDVLGWVLEAAAGERMPALMSELLWSPIGAEFDADIAVDSSGTGFFDGGISATLRDLARFGAMVVSEGVSLTGVQVLPPEWVADSFAGGPDSREAFAASPSDEAMPGGMYRNKFWAPSCDPDVLLCIGIHGQLIYLNRRTQVVGVKLSSWATPQDLSRFAPTFHAFEAVSAALSD